MIIIQVTHEKEVPDPHRGYVMMQPHEAAQAYYERFGVNPEVVYQKVNSKGRSTCYIPISTEAT